MRTLRRLTRIVPLAAATATLVAAAPAAAQVTACPSATASPESANLDQVESTVLCLINRERTSRGLKRLQSDGKLARAAVSHSRDMVRRGYFDHTSPGGSTVLARIKSSGWVGGGRSYTVGENLAWGTGELADPASIVDQWMHSAGHRANILNPVYREIGIGVVIGVPDADDGATYTTDFGAKR